MLASGDQMEIQLQAKQRPNTMTKNSFCGLNVEGTGTLNWHFSWVHVLYIHVITILFRFKYVCVCVCVCTRACATHLWFSLKCLNIIVCVCQSISSFYFMKCAILKAYVYILSLSFHVLCIKSVIVHSALLLLWDILGYLLILPYLPQRWWLQCMPNTGRASVYDMPTLW